MMPTDADIHRFVYYFQSLHNIATMLFVGSILAAMNGCSAAVKISYNTEAFLVSLVTLGTLVLFLIFYASMMNISCLALVRHRRKVHMLRKRAADQAAARVPVIVKSPDAD
ncbi:hypothetical protein HYH03_001671 [Edaphochlamys debaryana]|uniref:Uncharacterized protein n=1 Tax=Edaphochlamys debaryana TaxID=47281 RepID=A0A835YDG2_9CHLO|nr:hypothetical protein HYH03_001671 [Edaphochlamys debaryana]|eukprot:KAG2500912.1 hypothetical protein HYH03_001671 [Edaphochlamys debaryana]